MNWPKVTLSASGNTGFEEWGEVQADKYLDELDSVIQSLPGNPELGIERDYVHDGYRVLFVASHATNKCFGRQPYRLRLRAPMRSDALSVRTDMFSGLAPRSSLVTREREKMR
jgi:ParE toxin of type II toxin-antitoxin system, parDE